MYYKSNIIKLIALAGILICLSACKKFPENSLWFKQPAKVFKGGYITSFTMNGIDIMPYYKNLYKVFPYNYYGKSIENVFDVQFQYTSSNRDLDSDIGNGSLIFSKTQREVEISFKPLNWEYGAENIFLANLSWKILKLTKSGQMKIQADYNYKKYEIQFN